MKRIFFSPYSAIWKHTEIEIAHLFEYLDESVENVFISCNRELNFYCNAMTAFGLTEESTVLEKDQVCSRCTKTLDFKGEVTDVAITYVSDHISDIDEKLIQDFVAGVNQENWKEATFLGINLGIISTYEIFLRYKITEGEIPPNLWQAYLQQLRYCAVIAALATNIVSTKDIESVVLYNDLYSLNRTFQEVAKKFGVSVISLQANGTISNQYSRYSVDTLERRTLELFESSDWEKARDTPLSPLELWRVYRFLRGLLNAKSFWVYSERTRPKIRRSDFRKALGLPVDKKILLMTLSSQDEWFAESFSKTKLDGNGLISQIDLVSRVIECFRTSPDWFLIIRPHPREFPNKREMNISTHGVEIQNYFKNQILPSNVILDYPESKNSLYQLISISDYVFNVLSSVGAESTALGVPVLSLPTEQFSAYPRELNYYVRDDLSDLTSLVSLQKINPEVLSRFAFRWYHFRYYQATTSKYRKIPKSVFRFIDVARGFYVKYNFNTFAYFARFLFYIIKRFSSLHIRNYKTLQLRYETNTSLKWLSGALQPVYSRIKLGRELFFLRLYRFFIKKSIFRFYD